jgi:hypothetical protein
MEHTPGPWKWWTRESGRPENYDLSKLLSDTREDEPILTLYGGEGFNAIGEKEEDIANARLIAAAPEMLEALSVARVALKLRLKSTATPTELSVLLLIEDVIAKAKGEVLEDANG